MNSEGTNLTLHRLEKSAGDIWLTVATVNV